MVLNTTYTIGKKSEIMNNIINDSILNITNTIIVKSNPAKINNESEVKLSPHKVIVKETSSGNVLISDEVNFDTISKNIEVNNYLSSRINRDFIQKVKTSSNIIKDDSCFRKLFNKVSIKTLINKLIEYSNKYQWLIISEKILKILSRCKLFTKSESDSCNIGKINNCKVYIDKYCDDNNAIYFGTQNSIIPVLKERIEVEKAKSLKDDNAKVINIEYTFIENDYIRYIKI